MPPLVALEEEWLCLRGGVIYTASKGGIAWAGEGVQYDFTSFYPSIQLSECLLPNCQPMVRTLSAETFPRFGLHRALVIIPGPGAKLWKYAPRVAVFTSTDLRTEHLLIAVGGGSVILADDGQPNALLYEDDKVQCKEAFGGFVNDLHPLKVAGKPVAKLVLNTRA